jgi:membrane dipeptidase
MLIVDGHLDLAYNAMQWNRDLTCDIAQIRAQEQGMTDRKGRGANTVCLPEMRRGEVFLALAPVQARIERPGTPRAFRGAESAHAVAKGYLHYYSALQTQGEIRLIRDSQSLRYHLSDWQQDRNWQSGGATRLPVGVVVTMEGADPILTPDQVWEWHELGVRVVSLSHFGPSTYAHGTGTPGGLFPLARPLLREMEAAGLILDTTHLAEQAFWEAMESFSGPVVATHQNCRALVPGDRTFSDDMLRALIERGAVIAQDADCWQLSPGWVVGQSDNATVKLEAVVDHIDHVCQLAGNAGHAAIGSDLDGGFGREGAPHDLETIADLQRIPEYLARRGYKDTDIARIMHGNWVAFLDKHWQSAQSSVLHRVDPA